MNAGSAAGDAQDANAGGVAGVFGLRGELKIAASRIGEDALVAGMRVRATLRDGSVRELRVRSLRQHKGRPLAVFEGIDDANAAQELVGAGLTVECADVSLAKNEYFDDDLVGCRLVDAADGHALGDVVGVEHYPAQDVLLVVPRQARDDTQRAIVPMVRAFVKTIDLRAKRITVELPPGLLDMSEAEEA